MAKKKEKESAAKPSANPADALRDAVERTFQGAAGAMGGAAGAQKRVQDVFDDFASALTRLRETVDEKRVLETLESLREEVQGLGRRVADLERDGKARPAARRKPPASGTKSSGTRAKPAASKAAKRKPAKRRPASGGSSDS